MKVVQLKNNWNKKIEIEIEIDNRAWGKPALNTSKKKQLIWIQMQLWNMSSDWYLGNKASFWKQVSGFVGIYLHYLSFLELMKVCLQLNLYSVNKLMQILQRESRPEKTSF